MNLFIGNHHHLPVIMQLVNIMVNVKFGVELEEGLNAVIVNPGIILGPGFWHQSSGKLIDTCYKGNPFYTEWFKCNY
jgi:hypothetical protein